MASQALPSPEVLRQLLRYEPETGKLFWLPRPREIFASHNSFATWNTRFAGREAFTSKTRNGYFQSQILGHLALAHRVIWAIVTGSYPVEDIDHMDTDRTNNRWSNLREASRSENMRNRGKTKANSSGVKGVTPNGSKWRAQIMVQGRQIYLGLHSTPDRAAAAYAEASVRLHGDFGRQQS